MGGAEGTRKVLRAQESKMVLDREHLRLSMEVPLRGPLVAASGDPEGSVLDDLKRVAGCSWGVGEPDWGSIREERPYE